MSRLPGQRDRGQRRIRRRTRQNDPGRRAGSHRGDEDCGRALPTPRAPSRPSAWSLWSLRAMESPRVGRICQFVITLRKRLLSASKSAYAVATVGLAPAWSSSSPRRRTPSARPASVMPNPRCPQSSPAGSNRWPRNRAAVLQRQRDPAQIAWPPQHRQPYREAGPHGVRAGRVETDNQCSGP